MAFVELTDKTCPECGAFLEIRLQLQSPAVAAAQETVKVDRLLVCPECGYTRDSDDPET
jgi:transposase